MNMLPSLKSPAKQILKHTGLNLKDLSVPRGRMLSRKSIFFALVILPTALATVFYGVIATDRYGSEAQFIVRSGNTQKAGGLERLFQSFGLARTVDDGNAVQSYLLSRDAVRELSMRVPLKEMFSRKSIDVFSRFPHFWTNNSFEALYDYYLEHVYVVQNPTKGIFSIYAIAFDSDDARRIATELLTLAEEMVNRLNARAQSDTIAASKRDLDIAGDRFVQAQRKLTEYRNKVQFVDPTSTSTSMLDTITSLSTDLATSIAELDNLRRVSPANPAIGAATDKVESLRREIQRQRLNLVGNDGALAAKLAAFEQLMIEQKLAQSSLSSASQALDQARLDAQRKAIYLETVVAPNLPDESNEPKRIRLIVTVFVMSFAGASVIWLLAAGAREHVIT